MPSFDSALEKCRDEGARLWQPRNLDFFNNFKPFIEPDFKTMFNGTDAYVAIGLELRWEEGLGIPYYPDGTPVPRNMLDPDWFATKWDETNENYTCMAFNRNVTIVNVPCNGYRQGKRHAFPFHYLCLTLHPRYRLH